MVRDVNLAKGIDLSAYSDHHVLDMEQYNLFPNITVLVFADMLSVVRARPGTHVEEAFMDVFSFERRPTADGSPRTQPFDALLPPDAEPPFGLVLNQDVGNFARSQRGLHQPGLHAPHGVAHRGVPHREPAPHARGVPRHQSHRAGRSHR